MYLAVLIPIALGPPSIDQQQVEAKPIPKTQEIPVAIIPAQTQEPSTQPIIVAATGSKYDWMRAAGIAESDWQYVEAILGQESTWRTDVVNYLGCIGLGQACPFGNKQEMLDRCPDWATNGECQMKVWNDYALRRYGSWAYANEWKFCTKSCYNAHTGLTTYKNDEPWW